MTDSDATQGDNMSPAEFAKLMGAYPQPAENPLPTYGGYMDNSAANFSWVQNNDYFGAESFNAETVWCDNCAEDLGEEDVHVVTSMPVDFDSGVAGESATLCGDCHKELLGRGAETFEADSLKGRWDEGTTRIIHGVSVTKTRYGGEMWEKPQYRCDYNGYICRIFYEGVAFYLPCWMYRGYGGVGRQGCFKNPMEAILDFKMRAEGDFQNQRGTYKTETFEAEPRYSKETMKIWQKISIKELNKIANKLGTSDKIIIMNYIEDNISHYSAKTYEAPYAGAGSLFGIGQNTGLEGFTTSELTTSSAIHGDFDEASLNYSGHQNLEVRAETFEAEKMGWEIKEYGNDERYASKDGIEVLIAPIRKSSYQYHPRDAKWKLTYGRDTPHGVVPLAKLFGTYGEVFRWLNNPPFEVKSFGAETFEAEDSDYDDYLDELEEDALVLYKDNPSHLFEKAYPIDYEVGMNDYESYLLTDIQSGDTQNSKMFDEDENLTPYGERVLKEMYDSLIDEALGIEWLASKHPPSELLKRGDPMAYRVGLSEYQDFKTDEWNGLSAEEYYAEMEELTEGVASITNRFGDGVGIIQVDDEDLEDVSVEITDGDGDVVYEGILGDEDTPEMEEEDFYYSENKKKSSILPMALGIAGAIFAYQPMMDFLARKTKKEEKMAETPELIENPNTGNLDPAQYEEMIVESTGYSVDVIPQVLDGSFMGSRFAALPTERYVEYNEPGIGAHTDIAMNRDEMYLEPEMAMVQASESIKESQAPGQSPYNSTTGEENPDFDVRVLKETTVVSLDPAVKPFIPQSMSGYTGNANTPPSVYDKMFNIGVLGQTPSFVPGTPDIGASRTGSRSAIPNSLGIAGAVGGPLSDQVNANYTDGQTSMSLAQWAIENTVSQTSDTEAVVIDRSSGAMKRVRRV